MRVRHLNDIEIQAMLDRRSSALNGSIPGNRYLKDLEAQEHLDNCSDCLAEVALYRKLFGELAVSDESGLPKNFASKVTFSLPPFRAQRTRARLQLAAVWSGAALVTLVWFLSKLNWAGLLSQPVLYVAIKLDSVMSWLNAAVAAVEIPSFDLARFAKPLHELTDSIEKALATDGSAVSFVVLACCVVMLIATLDRLYLTGARRQRDSR